MKIEAHADNESMRSQAEAEIICNEFGSDRREVLVQREKKGKRRKRCESMPSKEQVLERPMNKDGKWGKEGRVAQYPGQKKSVQEESCRERKTKGNPGTQHNEVSAPLEGG